MCKRTTYCIGQRNFGRLFDLTGAYNHELWSERFETPAFVRDCNAFEQDKEAIASDINKAFAKMQSTYTKK